MKNHSIKASNRTLSKQQSAASLALLGKGGITVIGSEFIAMGGLNALLILLALIINFNNLSWGEIPIQNYKIIRGE
jgi:hypothetical protein